MQDDFDLIVIGAGSGGVRAARMAAATGARVAVCEQSRLGGTCVNLGCIPKKLFVYAAHVQEECEDAEGFGWDIGSRHFAWPRLIRAKDIEISRLNGVYERLLKNANVEIFNGHARLCGPHEVMVGERTLRGQRILVAVGSRPSVPDFPGAEHAHTSDAFFHLDELPARVVVIGGGYIAVELASVLHGLGARVTLCHRGEMFLRGFDDGIRRFLAAEMEKKGIAIRFAEAVRSIQKASEGLCVHFASGDKVATDLVLAATGRLPRTDALGLDAVGVEMDARGAIVVDQEFRSSVPSVFALGDVIDRYQLTPVALAEAMAFVRIHFENKPSRPDYEYIPTAVFSLPNVGTVGLSEESARQQFRKIAVYQSEFRALKHTLSGRNERTLMKLIVDDETERVLGCHMVGADAGEIIQGFAVSLRCGATKTQFDQTIGIHPTAAEEFVTMRTPRA